MSRLEKSFKNTTFSFANTIISSVIGFISRTVFIYCLGESYLGLSGLLSNILGFLTISELGIATAIGFSLYKPLAQKDYSAVSALMSIYRKAYAVIGAFVAVAGTGMFFFLDFFIPPDQQPVGTSVAYFAYLISTVFGYFLSYKTTLISSDNQAYKLVPLNVLGETITSVLQIIALLLFKNYVIYLIVHIGCGICLMCVRNVYITRHYKQIDFHTKERLTPDQSHTIKKNIGGLIISKIGDYLVNSTDNLIITKLVSLTATGIYSNYLLIRGMVNGVIATFFGGITASMGNVVAIESDEKKLEVFETLLFSAYFVYSFEAVCFMCLFNPFIGDIWIGEDYLFDNLTVFIIVINNFLTGMRIPLITMKGAAGKFMEDSWIPFGFAGINLIASIILAHYMGVAGVFLGTIIGSLLTADWYRPIVIYRHVLHTPVKKYFRKYSVYVILGVTLISFSYFVCKLINTPYTVLTFIIKCVIAVMIPLIINTLLFFRKKEFATIVSMVKRIIGMNKRKEMSK